MRAAATLVAAAILLGAATAASAPLRTSHDPAVLSDATWSSMEMAGEKAGLCRVAGFNDRIEASRLALELIRLIHGDRLTGAVPADRTRAAILTYLATIEQFAGAVSSLRTPELTGGTATRSKLREMEPVMALLGVGFDPKSSTPWHDLPHRADAVRQTREFLAALKEMSER